MTINNQPQWCGEYLWLSPMEMTNIFMSRYSIHASQNISYAHYYVEIIATCRLTLDPVVSCINKEIIIPYHELAFILIFWSLYFIIFGYLCNAVLFDEFAMIVVKRIPNGCKGIHGTCLTHTHSLCKPSNQTQDVKEKGRSNIWLLPNRHSQLYILVFS